MKTNALYYGDNLTWLRDHKYFPSESIDLIYLDPPFNSKANYNLLFNEPSSENKSQAQIKAFDDTWSWDSESSAIAYSELASNKPTIAELISWLSSQGNTQKSIAAYLSMMAIRLIELHRVLKQTGSLYLHCDPTASHYLKLLLDGIFGMNNFQNEIVWCYKSGGASSKRFARKHHIILFYSKNNEKYQFNTQKERSYMAEGSGQNPSQTYYEDENGIYTIVNMKDWWQDIGMMATSDHNRLGYPTQKPVALLERIIQASSNEGETVLDPFCGCGTTVDAAQKLGRQWRGIDVTWLAIDLIEKRLKNTYGSKLSKYDIHGNPFDYASAKALANKNKKEFEIWAISLVGAAPREHDGGVDGIFGFVDGSKKIQKVIVQVKGGETLNPGMVRDLIGTVKNEKAAIGLLITLNDATSGMKQLAVHSTPYHSDVWNKNYPSVQIKTVEELINGDTFDLPPTHSPLKKAKIAKESATQGQF